MLWLAGIVVAGVTLSLITFGAIRSRQSSEVERRVTELTLSRVEKLRISILRSMEVLHSLAALHGMERGVDRTQFREFVQPALARQRELQALSWNPLIRDTERSAFEAQMTASGLGEFAMHDHSPEGRRIAAPPRDEHVPVGWIEPFDRNASAVGFDLNSDSARRRCLELARDSGQPVATAPIQLAQAQEDSAGFLVVLPVYKERETPISAQLRRQTLSGYFVAVFRTSDLVSSTLQELRQLGILARLTDDGPAGGDISGSNSIPLGRRISFEVANRQWNLVYEPAHNFETPAMRLSSWGTLIMGLAFTGLITGYVHRGWRRGLDATEANLTLQREIAERMRAETAAETANSAKSVFLASMSHEIRTPLNAILGYAQILQRDPRLTTDQLDAIVGIGVSGHHLLGLINEVLDLSKIEAGKMELTLGPFHMGSLGRGLSATFQPLCAQKGIGFRLELDPATARWVVGDEGKLRQVLINLAGNAVKFTEVGEVCIGIHAAPGDRWRFEVRDTGLGIPMEEHTRIFQPFHRGNGAQHLGGTGLGLTIAQRQVELMGGSLRLESERGRGSSFQFDLHLSAAQRQPEDPPPVVDRLANGCHVLALVVDDRLENRDVLERILKDIGCDVRVAVDGASAVQACRQSPPPDIAFLDLLMPGLSFEETVHSMRESAGPGFSIVAHSASALPEMRARALAAGCVEFLPKPIRCERIYATLERFLGVQFKQRATPSEDSLDSSGNLRGLRIQLPEPLSARLAVAAELHSTTALKSALTELRALGPDAKLLADHIRHRMRAYDMHGIQIILAQVVTPITSASANTNHHASREFDVVR